MPYFTDTKKITLFGGQVTLEMPTYRSALNEYESVALSNKFKSVFKDLFGDTSNDGLCELWAEILIHTKSATFNWNQETGGGWRVFEQAWAVYESGAYLTDVATLFKFCLATDNRVLLGYEDANKKRVSGLRDAFAIAISIEPTAETSPLDKLTDEQKTIPN